jgi:DNA-binding NtrC family response regulator
VREGRFREDLYYRLKVFPIHLPPLRKRREDIPLLVRHFVDVQNQKTGKQIRSVSPPALRILMDYQWSGNVRELENAIEHAFVLCAADPIDVFDLPVEIRRAEYQPMASGRPESSPNTHSSRQKMTRKSLVALLGACDWNKAEAARRIGLSRTAVWKYMKKWDIPLSRPNPGHPSDKETLS